MALAGKPRTRGLEAPGGDGFGSSGRRVRAVGDQPRYLEHRVFREVALRLGDSVFVREGRAGRRRK